MRTITKVMIIVAVVISLSYTANAQICISTEGTNPDSSAMLDVKSSDKGVLIPRMTQPEIRAITSPANGLTVFNTTDDKFYTFISADAKWKEIAFGSGTITPGFACGDVLIDSRDSQSYTTVQIGTQCWMRENLNVGTQIYTYQDMTDNGTIEKYCYEDETANCNTYGGLYQWEEMMQYTTTQGVQGICPDGWHLPSDDEWKTLEMYLGMTQAQADSVGWRGNDEGGKLKEAGDAHWQDGNSGATNSSGFTGLPGGTREDDGYYHEKGYYGYWWTSTESSDTTGWGRQLSYGGPEVDRDKADKQLGRSVRCVKD